MDDELARLQEALVQAERRASEAETRAFDKQRRREEEQRRREEAEERAVYKAQIVPLKKKLNKCHDPDRWNLVELQKVRREQALSSTKKLDGSENDSAALKDDGAVFGNEAKRRKVSGNKRLEDPFGGPL
ncbi:hypothetical protein B0H66DRAFT_213920 [Apodospora peruviana]|uniref:Uncharacterized protein n=1 Tax=Apodospora peruviana TaxID=516989 RepID=A0AAE0M9C1_9PEZI|nr:hypothetical protein B0H66DRAFT_213920 [Apodospora peruviana]